jgi:hypothetical protein
MIRNVCLIFNQEIYKTVPSSPRHVQTPRTLDSFQMMFSSRLDTSPNLKISSNPSI